MPWHLPEDLKRFRRLTIGKPVIMGRLTHESIGRPLPKRRNIVISRQPEYVAPGCDVVRSPAAALEVASAAPEIMVIGGGYVYREFLPLADRIQLTRVHASPEGDAFFPSLDEDEWQTDSVEDFPADAERRLGYSFATLTRRGGPG